MVRREVCFPEIYTGAAAEKVSILHGKQCWTNVNLDA